MIRPQLFSRLSAYGLAAGKQHISHTITPFTNKQLKMQVTTPRFAGFWRLLSPYGFITFLGDAGERVVVSGILF